MKIFQVLNNVCHWDATAVHPNIESTRGRYAPNIHFVEAPDYVFGGWGYDDTQIGDARFIKPELPEPAEWIDEHTGQTYHWAYDDSTGTYYIAGVDGKPIQSGTLEEAIEALQDAHAALALLGVHPEEVSDDE